MTALLVHAPDNQNPRLRARAQSQGTPFNRLIDDMATAQAMQSAPQTAAT